MNLFFVELFSTNKNKFRFFIYYHFLDNPFKKKAQTFFEGL